MPNFSCYFIIDNSLGPAPLTYDHDEITDGKWAAPPPQTIPLEEKSFDLNDIAGTSRGAEGAAVYYYLSGSTKIYVRFFMSCPLIGDNEAYWQKKKGESGAYGQKVRCDISTSGHPLTAHFIL